VQSKGFEAITVFLLEWIDILGMIPVAMKLFPVLEQIKDSILSGDFDQVREPAEVILGMLRRLNEAVDREIRDGA